MTISSVVKTFDNQKKKKCQIFFFVINRFYQSLLKIQFGSAFTSNNLIKIQIDLISILLIEILERLMRLDIQINVL